MSARDPRVILLEMLDVARKARSVQAMDQVAVRVDEPHARAVLQVLEERVPEKRGLTEARLSG